MTAMRFILLASVSLALMTTMPRPRQLFVAQAAIFVTPGDDDDDGGSNATAIDDGEAAEVPVEVMFAEPPETSSGAAGQRSGYGMDIGRMVASQMTEEDVLVIVCDNHPANVFDCQGVPDMRTYLAQNRDRLLGRTPGRNRRFANSVNSPSWFGSSSGFSSTSNNRGFNVRVDPFDSTWNSFGSGGSFSSSNQGYNSGNRGFSSGSQGYGSNQGHSSGNQGYGSNQGHSSGNQGYGSNQGHSSGNQGYGSNRGHSSGNQGYGSTNQGFSSGNQGYGSTNHGNYGSGSQGFNSGYNSGNQGFNFGGQGYNSGNQGYTSGGQGHSGQSYNRNTGNAFICPTPLNQTALYQLNPDSTGYPAMDIAAALAADPTLLACLVEEIVLGTTPPFVIIDDFRTTSNLTCPFNQLRLWQYQSLNQGAMCWVLANFGDIVLYRNCTERLCRNCTDSKKGSSHFNQYGNRYTTHHQGYQQTTNGLTQKLCITDYRATSLWAYCPTNAAGAQIVRDRIILPLSCSCQSVLCEAIPHHR